MGLGALREIGGCRGRRKAGRGVIEGHEWNQGLDSGVEGTWSCRDGAVVFLGGLGQWD